jgi:cytoskeletal protein RodZ
MKKARKSKKHSHKAYALLALIVVLVVGFFLIKHFTSNKQSTPRSENQYTKGTQSTNEGTKGSSPTTPVISTTNPSSSSTATLTAPSGNFVSDHHPNLSGSPAPNSMTSVCNTTPGASCQITFTNGSVQKSLASQVTDGGGSTYWSWTLQNVGLTAGSWQVKAITTLGSQTQSTTDTMALVVSQ